MLWCFVGLLYQEYRDKSTRQEIETRRLQDSQTDAEECTATEDTASQTEATNTEESKAVPQICLLRNSTSRFNLWQDLPEVRSSGVLNILQPDEIKLQEVIQLQGRVDKRSIALLTFQWKTLWVDSFNTKRHSLMLISLILVKRMFCEIFNLLSLLLKSHGHPVFSQSLPVSASRTGLGCYSNLNGRQSQG